MSNNNMTWISKSGILYQPSRLFSLAKLAARLSEKCEELWKEAAGSPDASDASQLSVNEKER